MVTKNINPKLEGEVIVHRANGKIEKHTNKIKLDNKAKFNIFMFLVNKGLL